MGGLAAESKLPRVRQLLGNLSIKIKTTKVKPQFEKDFKMQSPLKRAKLVEINSAVLPNI